MATTVYLQPGTGFGSGTLADPYYYSELVTAETAAGAGGTILFTDGQYLLGSVNNIFDGLGNGNELTYRSLNRHKAVLYSTATGNKLNINYGSNTADINFHDFKLDNLSLVVYNSGGGLVSGNYSTASNLTIGTNTNLIKANTSSGTSRVINNTFHLAWSSGTYITRQLGYLAEFSGNTIYISNLSSATSVQVTYSATNDIRSCPIVKNNIFASDDTTGTKLDTLNSWSGSMNNCCFHQFDDSNNASGGTDNVFADPQFVDPTNVDLRLRPTSPCISAGTSS
jgi:hypothetical protein